MLTEVDRSLVSVAGAVLAAASFVWLRRFIRGWRRASRQHRHTVVYLWPRRRV
jgi:hypothetical protein